MKKLRFHELRDVFYRIPILMTLLFSVGFSVLAAVIALVISLFSNRGFMDSGVMSSAFIISFFLILPAILTAENIAFLVMKPKTGKEAAAVTKTDLLGIVTGALFSLLYMGLLSNVVWKEWDAQLYNSELHAPVSPETFPTVLTIAAVWLAGYLFLRLVPLRRQPPLATVLGVAALYLGAALSVTWCVQLGGRGDTLLLCLFPANCAVISAKTVRWLASAKAEEPEDGEPRPGKLAALLRNSANWPWLGAVAAIPLLGVLAAILTLFGQRPDAVIRAWTETADWTLSQKIGPQNIQMDEHYLCTVAAGGHRNVVRPLRTGIRHGHRVVVNRQLCVANAFEQLLEERTPRFHRAVRGFYDRAGYPIARHIRSPYVADAVYFLMKPLEWAFLAALYLFDPKPENRIAVQYPHSAPPAGR